MKEVYLAFLQSAVTFAGGGSTESTLSDTKIKGIKMALDDAGNLWIEARGKKSFVPSTQIKIAFYNDEPDVEEVKIKRRSKSNSEAMPNLRHGVETSAGK